jgi:hypothetical protein
MTLKKKLHENTLKVTTTISVLAKPQQQMTRMSAVKTL